MIEIKLQKKFQDSNENKILEYHQNKIPPKEWIRKEKTKILKFFLDSNT